MTSRNGRNSPEIAELRTLINEVRIGLQKIAALVQRMIDDEEKSIRELTPRVEKLEDAVFGKKD